MTEFLKLSLFSIILFFFISYIKDDFLFYLCWFFSLIFIYILLRSTENGKELLYCLALTIYNFAIPITRFDIISNYKVKDKRSVFALIAIILIIGVYLM